MQVKNTYAIFYINVDDLCIKNCILKVQLHADNVICIVYAIVFDVVYYIIL